MLENWKSVGLVFFWKSLLEVFDVVFWIVLGDPSGATRVLWLFGRDLSALDGGCGVATVGTPCHRRYGKQQRSIPSIVHWMMRTAV